MDLTGALLRAGATRPHMLAVTMPGATMVRLAVEEAAPPGLAGGADAG